MTIRFQRKTALRFCLRVLSIAAIKGRFYVNIFVFSDFSREKSGRIAKRNNNDEANARVDRSENRRSTGPAGVLASNFLVYAVRFEFGLTDDCRHSGGTRPFSVAGGRFSRTGFQKTSPASRNSCRSVQSVFADGQNTNNSNPKRPNVHHESLC